MKITIEVDDFFELYKIAEELVKWESEPDKYSGDLADLAIRARLLIDREV